MGVPGLWDILRPAGHTRSITHLAIIDGFERNRDNLRGYRVGIDASIWIFHSEWGREGENPQLRTIFFRCVKLMNSPFLPLFVFDGPGRPGEKRGKKITKRKPHSLIEGMKRLIAAFGYEWRTAPGEAEAELAYLNRVGVIDAVLSDDVDSFLFGATVVIRNSSATLTGNKCHSNRNAAGRHDDLHTTIYYASDILSNSAIQLTQGGLILFALLSGGDYHPAGLKGCGGNTAHALARCSLGDELLHAVQTLDRHELEHVFLPHWREALRTELRTDSRGFMGRKRYSLANSVPEDFPDLDILFCYTNPLTTEVDSRGRNEKSITWDCDPSPAAIAAACEQFFEWGYEEKMLQRFRNFLWAPLVARMLRRAALDGDNGTSFATQAEGAAVGARDSSHFNALSNPSKVAYADGVNPVSVHDLGIGEDRLIIKIHSERTHPSTDNLLEYRLEIAPARLVRLCKAGIIGSRPRPVEDDQYADRDDERTSAEVILRDTRQHLRIWMPASMMKLAAPNIVKEWKERGASKPMKKVGKGKTPDTSDLVAPSAQEQDSRRGRQILRHSGVAAATVGSINKSRTKNSPRNKPQKVHGPHVLLAEGGRPEELADLKDYFAVTKPSRRTKNKPTAGSGSTSSQRPKPGFLVYEDLMESHSTLSKPCTSRHSVMPLTNDVLGTFDVAHTQSQRSPLSHEITPPARSPSSTPLKQPRIKASYTSLSSDIGCTSPRRNQNHVSSHKLINPLRGQRDVQREESRSRPVSPSLSRSSSSPQLVRPLPLEVIEISSDSDTTAPSLAPRHVRHHTKIKVIHNKRLLIHESNTKAHLTRDIIDLT